MGLNDKLWAVNGPLVLRQETDVAIVNTIFKIIAWYDNEWAYASRLVDLALLLRHDRRLP